MAAHHGRPKLGDQAKLCSFNHVYQDGDQFGRMFDLPGLYLDPRTLVALGDKGGPMDAAAAPATQASRTTSVPVGHVFLGQFIDHDITLDLTSSFGRVNEPSQIANARTPTLDLDCVYGSGPEGSNFLYQASGAFKGVKLVTNRDMRPRRRRGPEDNDVPRNAQGVALIGDFRNDENRVISQLQLAMIRVHNKFCDEITAAQGLTGHDLYEAAREATTWHYQWAVVHDFLPAMCGAPTVNRILSEGRQHYQPSIPFMPVEFSVAAYRFGHSMAPLDVQIRKGGGAARLFGATLGRGFDAVTSEAQIAEWDELFFTGGQEQPKVQRAERCDALLSTELLDLEILMNEPIPGDRSLATRNLRRGQSFRLPSGEVVAKHMERDDAEIAQVSAAAETAAGGLLDGATPLWFYVLTEGAVLGRGGVASDLGEGLGPVGGTIVAEVIIGLLECDERSWLASNRDWAPISGRETIGDLLVWASS